MQILAAATKSAPSLTRLLTRMAAPRRRRSMYRPQTARTRTTLTTAALSLPESCAAAPLWLRTMLKTRKKRSRRTRALTLSTTGGILYPTSARNWTCFTVRHRRTGRRKRNPKEIVLSLNPAMAKLPAIRSRRFWTVCSLTSTIPTCKVSTRSQNV